MFDGVCEIRRAGVTADGRAQVDIRAIDGSFDWRWAISGPGRSREVLAVALTAIATHQSIVCAMSNANQDWPPLDGFFGIAK